MANLDDLSLEQLQALKTELYGAPESNDISMSRKLDSLSLEDLYALKRQEENTARGLTNMEGDALDRNAKRLRNNLGKEIVSAYQEPSLWAKTKRYAGMIPRGIARAPGDVADILAMPYNATVGKLIDKQLPSLGEKTAEAYDELTGHKYGPLTKRERISQHAISDIASMPLTGGVGGKLRMASKLKGAAPSRLSRAASQVGDKTGQFFEMGNTPTMANIASTGAASLGAHNELEERPGNLFGALLGGTIAGTVPHGIAGIGATADYIKNQPHKAATLAGQIVGLQPEELAKFRELGLNPTVAMVSDNPLTNLTENVASHSLFGGKKIQDTYKGLAADAERKLGLSAQSEISQAQKGEIIQNSLDNYRKEVNNEYRKYMDKIEKRLSKIDDGEFLTPSKTISAFDKELLRKGGQTQQEVFMQSPIWKFREEIEKDLVRNRGKIDLPSLRAIRENINERTHNKWNQTGDLKEGLAKHIVANIDKDINAHIKAISPKSYKDFKDAQKYWHEYSELDKKTVNAATKEYRMPEVFNTQMRSLTKGGYPLKTYIKSASRKEGEEVLKGYLYDLSLNNKNESSVFRLASKFQGLEPEVQNTLLHYQTPDQRKETLKFFNAINKASKGLGSFNSSFSGYTMQNILEVGGAASAIANAIVTQDPSLLLKSLSYPLANYVGASMLGNQAAMDAAAEGIRVANLRKGKTSPTVYNYLINKISKIPGIKKETIDKLKQAYAKGLVKVKQEGVVKGSLTKSARMATRGIQHGPTETQEERLAKKYGRIKLHSMIKSLRNEHRNLKNASKETIFNIIEKGN